MFQVHDLSLQSMTAAWLLPVVPPIVAAAAGGVVADVLNRNHAISVLIVSYMQLGVGMGMSLLVMVVYFYRLCVHKLPAADVVVSTFIPLGPPGMSAFSLIQLAEVGLRVFNKDQFAGITNAAEVVYVSSVITALCVWGFGLWWLLHAVLSVLVQQMFSGSASITSSSTPTSSGRSGSVAQFNIGYWAYTFPLGVYCLGAMSLADALQSSPLAWVAMVLLVTLLMLLAAVSYATVCGILRGSLVAPAVTHDVSYYFGQQRQQNSAVQR